MSSCGGDQHDGDSADRATKDTAPDRTAPRHSIRHTAQDCRLSGDVTSRLEMQRALSKLVVQLLRQRGFSGRMPHFRRLRADKTDLITFQFDRNGGGFVIEVAEGPATALVKKWGKVVQPDKLSAYDVNPPARKRVKRDTGGSTASWFRYDGELSADEVAEEVVGYVPQIDDWFAGEKDQPNIG